MTSHNTSNMFLELPTELRMMIYSYALTSSQPVYGTTVSINTGGRTIYLPKLYAQEKFMVRSQANYLIDSEAEFNQLRYVCRQMCQETRGLSLRHNDIIIKYKGSVTARELCCRFLSSIASAHHRRIQRIDIIEAAERNDAWYPLGTSANQWYAIGQLLTGAEYPTIHTFCRANQKTGAKVLLRFEWGSLSLGGNDRLDRRGLALLLFHAVLRMLLRGESAVEMGIGNDVGLRIAIKWNKATIENGMRLGASYSGSRDGNAGTRSPTVLENLRVTFGTTWVMPTAEAIAAYGASPERLRVPVEE